jgi:uncharacterized membrane-anchored protein YitT (DUF2179 family)
MPTPARWKETDKWVTISIAALVIIFAYKEEYYSVAACVVIGYVIHFLLEWHAPP